MDEKMDLQNISACKIQIFFLKRLRRKMIYEKRITNIYGKIQDIMLTINNNFNIGISSQEKYKISMSELENIKDNYESFKISFDKLKIHQFSKTKTKKELDIDIISFDTKIQALYWGNGSLSIFHLLKYDFIRDNKFFINNTNFDKLLNFYNKVFITNKFKKFVLSDNPSLIYSNMKKSTSNQIVPFQGDDTYNQDLQSDIENIKYIFDNKLNNPVCRGNNNNNNDKKTLIEIIQGAII